MELFILYKNNKQIIAISEDESLMDQFILQNDYLVKNLKLQKINDELVINKFLLLCRELYLEEFQEFVIREIDRDSITRSIYDNFSIVEDTIEGLDTIINNSKISKKDISILEEAKDVLKKSLKPKNIQDTIVLKKILKNYYSNLYVGKEMHELNKLFKSKL